jgi:hypothetical protein
VRVRVKLYTPGIDNFGTKWQSVRVDDHGRGTVVFSVYRPSRWIKFRVASEDNSKIYQECFVNEGRGVEAEAGDAVTVDFVVHELAFRVRLNDDLDEEDETILNLAKMKRRLGKWEADDLCD